MRGQHQDQSTSKNYPNADFAGRLAIHAQTLAKHIMFDGKAARGMEVETGGSVYRVAAKREIILSCGATQTPQLMMVSGFGDKQLLSKRNIMIVHDLPGVGQNLQDHPRLGLSFAVNIDTAAKVIKNPSRMLDAVVQ